MERYCPYCMHPVQPGQPCPNCKRDPETYHPESRQLSPGTLLQERYVLGRALGAGGFGITYLGWDLKLERRVAVKEYFPTAFLKRETSVTLDVTCYTASGQEAYTKGREQFLREARTMAALEKIPQMVRVLDFFPEHNTAYIVMEFLEGQTLKEITQAQGPCSAQVLLPMLEPVIRAMESMHQANIIHRDISPDNLMLLSNGTVKLMDFGCARDIQGEVTMTAMLKEGFAPYEQYSGHGQGPWSDLYSLCATIYYCLTGKVPPSAMKRGEPDPLIPPSRLGAELTEQQERALLKGLAVRAAERWQSMGELYGALYGITLDGHPWTPPEDWEKWNPSKPDPEPEPTPEPKPEKKFALSRGPRAVSLRPAPASSWWPPWQQAACWGAEPIRSFCPTTTSPPSPRQYLLARKKTPRRRTPPAWIPTPCSSRMSPWMTRKVCRMKIRTAMPANPRMEKWEPGKSRFRTSRPIRPLPITRPLPPAARLSPAHQLLNRSPNRNPPPPRRRSWRPRWRPTWTPTSLPRRRRSTGR